MFHLASINSVGLVIRSKLLSTKGGVTGVSKSYVCQVRLGNFTMPAIHGGMEHRDLGEEKKKVLTQLHSVDFVKRTPLYQVSFEQER